MNTGSTWLKQYAEPGQHRHYIVLRDRQDGPDYVGADNRSGSREITAHLIEVHGHTDLAFLAGPADSPDSGERFEGFCEALRQAACRCLASRPRAAGSPRRAAGRRSRPCWPRAHAAGHRVR